MAWELPIPQPDESTPDSPDPSAAPAPMPDLGPAAAAFATPVQPMPMSPQQQFQAPPSLMPPPQPVAQDPKQQLLALATLGFMLGAGPRSGLATGAGHGLLQGQQNLDVDRQRQWQVQQANQIRQQAQLEQQARAAQVSADRRDAVLQTTIENFRKDAAGATTADQYDAIVQRYSSALQASGYRTMTPGFFNQNMPFTAPDAGKLAKAATDQYFANPIVKERLKKDPTAALKDTVMYDGNGDGIPEAHTVDEAMKAQGLQFLPTPTGAATFAPLGDANEWQTALSVANQMFVSKNGRAPATAEDNVWIQDQAKKYNNRKSDTDIELEKVRLDTARAQLVKARADANSGILTDDGRDYAATQYRVTGRMPPMGTRSAADRNSIINRAAEQARDLGQTPAVAIQQQAAYKADSAALTKMRTASSAAESFESKAIQQADIIRDLSQRVPRTKWPIINDAIVSGKAEIAGDADAQLLLNAVSTFSSEYAKIIEGATGSAAGSSDSSRKASAKLIKAGLNQGTMQKTLDLMEREMRFTVQGYDATINHITDRMGGNAPAAGADKPADLIWDPATRAFVKPRGPR